MANIQIFRFNEQEIEFDLTDETVMVNATEMAKAFGKRIDFFLKSDHANEFIKVLELTPFGGSSAPLKREEIIKTINGVSTWMHRVLALKFAAWLSPEFELWVYSTIDDLLFSEMKRLQQSIKESATRRNKIEDLKKQLFNDETYLELQRLELEEKQALYRRGKEIKMQLELFRNSDN